MASAKILRASDIEQLENTSMAHAVGVDIIVQGAGCCVSGDCGVSCESSCACAGNYTATNCCISGECGETCRGSCG